MTQEMFDKIMELLQTLAGQAGELARQGFALAVRREITGGALSIAFLVPSMAVLLWAVVYGIRKDRESEASDGGWLILSMLAAAVFIGCIFGLYSSIMHLLNPEWFAATRILQLVK